MTTTRTVKRSSAQHGRGTARTRRSSLWLARLAFAGALFASWEWVSGAVFDPFFVSAPTAVAVRLTQWITSGELFFHLWITLQELITGFLAGAALGVAFGIVVGLMPFVSEVLKPFIVSMYSVPKIALMPLFIVWFGLGMLPKILLALIGVFFVVFFSTFQGVKNVDRSLIDILRVMGASRSEIVRKVILPASAGWVFSGLRISLPQAFIGAVAGEILASNRGLGYLIANSAALFQTAGVFAGVIVLIATAWVMSVALDAVEARAVRWSAAEDLTRH